jgi:GDP-4-dehydro-6-deoxy-D-mannose reductase
MRVLITGITGFAGSHLADYLLAEQPGVEIYGICRWRSRRENITHLGDRVQLAEADLRDGSSLRQVVADVRPDAIFHLAAQSFVPTSWRAPTETLTTNIAGQSNLFEAVRSVGLDPVIQIAGSSEEYGLVLPDEVPIRESNPLRPLSPYAVSKVAQDLLAYQYFRSYGMKTVRTRGFNHTGPRRGDVFVSSNFAKQIAAIEAGRQQPVIRVGNLDAVRDFTDVRDMVRAYYLLLTNGEPGEVYNIGTGKARSIQQLLDCLLDLTDAPIEVHVDPARFRQVEVPIIACDASKLRARTGWKPEYTFEETLATILDDWRERVRTAPA